MITKSDHQRSPRQMPAAVQRRRRCGVRTSRSAQCAVDRYWIAAEHLDRRHAGRLDVGEPAERRAGEAAERVVREAAGPAADREIATQLGVHQRQHDDHRPRR